MQYIIFVASTNDADQPYIDEIYQEWEAWKSACNGKDCCKIDENDEKITISNDTYIVYIIKKSEWNRESGWNGFKEFVIRKTGLEEELLKNSPIYIHGSDYSIANALCEKGFHSAGYSSQRSGEPLFNAVKNLITYLYYNNKEEFFEELGNLKNFAFLKYLRDEIKVLSLSYLIDVAGYTECKDENRSNYLKEIRDARTIEKIEEKVKELSSSDNKYKALDGLLDAFRKQCETILEDKNKEGIKKVQESYFKFIKALE